MTLQTPDDSHLSPDATQLDSVRQLTLDAFQRAARLAASLPDTMTQETFALLSGANTEPIDPTEVQQIVDEIAVAAVHAHNILGRPLPDELEAWSRQPTPLAAESAAPHRTVAESAVCAGVPDSVCEWRFATVNTVLQRVRELTEAGDMPPETAEILDQLERQVADRRAKRSTAAESAARRPFRDVRPRGLRSVRATREILTTLGCGAEM